MSITFDAASNSGFQSLVSTYNWSHTSAGDYLVVGVSIFSGLVTVSGITFNGTALALLKRQTDSTGTAAELWGLASPAAGAHSVAVTLSGSTSSVAGAVTHSGVAASGSTEGAAGASGTGTSDISVAVTTTADNDVVIDCAATSDTAVTVGAGQTERVNVSGMGGSGVMSTEGPKTPAGSVTMSWTAVGAGNPWSTAAVALVPAGGGGGGGRLSRRSSLDGLGGVGQMRFNPTLEL